MGCGSSTKNAELGETKAEMHSLTRADLHKAGTLVDVDDINKKIAVDPPNVAETLNHLGHVCLEQKKFTEAKNFYERALRIYEKAHGGESITVGETKLFLAKAVIADCRYKNWLKYWSGDSLETDQSYKEAMEFAEQAIAIYKTVLGNEDVETAKAMSEIADIYSANGRYDEADEYFRKAMQVMDGNLTFNTQVSPRGLEVKFETSSQLNQISLAGGSGMLVTIFDFPKGGDLDRAGIKAGMEVFQVKEKDGKLRSISAANDIENLLESFQAPLTLYFREKLYLDALNCLVNWSIARRDSERHDEARELFLKAIKLGNFLHGEKSVEYAGVQKEFGHSLLQWGKFEEAYSRFASAFKVHEKNSDKILKEMGAKDLGMKGKIQTDDRLAIPTFLMIGMAQALMGCVKPAEAFIHAEKAVKLASKCYGPEHAQVGFSQNLAGANLYSLKRYEEAKEQFQNAHKTYAIALDDNHPATVHARANMASCLARHKPRLGITASMEGPGQDFEEAIKIYEEVLGQYAQAQLKDHAVNASIHSNIGHIYLKNGEFDKARNSFQKALEVREKALAPGNIQISLSSLLLAEACFYGKDYAAATNAAQSALDNFKTQLPKNHEAIAAANVILGNCALHQGKTVDAFESFEHAKKVRDKTLDIPKSRLLLSEYTRFRDTDADTNITDALVSLQEEQEKSEAKEGTEESATDDDALKVIVEEKKGKTNIDQEKSENEEEEMTPRDLEEILSTGVKDDFPIVPMNAKEEESKSVTETMPMGESLNKSLEQHRQEESEIWLEVDEGVEMDAGIPLGGEAGDGKQLSSGDELSPTKFAGVPRLNLDEISYCSSTPSAEEDDPRRKGMAGRVSIEFSNANMDSCIGVCAEWTDLNAAKNTFVKINLEVLPENHTGKNGVSLPMPDSKKPFCLLLMQGQCSFVEKAICAEEVGAIGFIVFRKTQ